MRALLALRADRAEAQRPADVERGARPSTGLPTSRRHAWPPTCGRSYASILCAPSALTLEKIAGGPDPRAAASSLEPNILRNSAWDDLKRAVGVNLALPEALGATRAAKSVADAAALLKQMAPDSSAPTSRKLISFGLAEDRYDPEGLFFVHRGVGSGIGARTAPRQ
jgi:hypothetical protein